MTKPKRQPRARAIERTKNPALFAQFEAGYKAGERLCDLCKRLQIKPNLAYTWASYIKVEIGAALRAMGITEISQARVLLQLQRTSRGRMKLDATKEISRLLDHYPAPKDQAPTAPAVTLIFNTANLILPGEQPDYHNDLRQIEQAPAVSIASPVVVDDEEATG